jgi:hypothetical protein
MDQDAGGSGSLIFGATAGLLRRVRNPTTTGMAIKINDKHRSTKPAVGGSVPELVTPFNSVLNGILPAAVKAPKIHKNNPGHPHKMTEAMVAMIPLVLSSMIHSPSKQIN